MLGLLNFTTAENSVFFSIKIVCQPYQGTGVYTCMQCGELIDKTSNISQKIPNISCMMQYILIQIKTFVLPENK